MTKFKRLTKSYTIWILIISLIFAVYQINPRIDTSGVLIVNSEFNSSAYNAGIQNPSSQKFSSFEKIISINGNQITNENDYYTVISSLNVNDSVEIKTDLDIYYFSIRQKYTHSETKQNITEIVSEFDILQNKTVNVSKIVEKTIVQNIPDGKEDIGLVVMDVPSTNIKKGLDISGGARILVKPVQNVDFETLEIIRNNLDQRLNSLGLKDVKVAIVNDLSDQNYIMITLAGKSNQDVLEVIQSQGKFEAKIGSAIVYSGDNNDILDVCRAGDCAYITQCSQSTDGYICQFQFSLTISEKGARRFGDITSNLNVVTVDEMGNILPENQRYLDKKIELYLDEKMIEELNIQSSLKGNRNANQISITGYGSGKTSASAKTEALKQMLKLQTLLKTGSIPVKLEVESYEDVSSALGKEFLQNSLYIGLLSILSVALVLAIRYRSLKITIPVIITMLSELIILLGLAVFLNWQLDLVAIAGILVSIGTGVDDQIVIVDESLGKRKDEILTGWKEKFARAFFIIFGSYLTVVFAMLPLMKAGAGLLKGFALTTIAGVTIGVFITRQAFAKFIEIYFQD